MHDYRNKIIRIGRVNIPTIQEQQMKIQLKNAKTLLIAPGRQELVRLHPHARLPDGIIGYKGVSNLKDGEAIFGITNLTPNPLIVEKGKPICMAVRMKPDDINEAGDEYISDEANWENKLPENLRKEPLTDEEFLRIGKVLIKIRPLVLKYKDTFYEYKNDPGRYTGKIEHGIRLVNTAQPIRHRLKKYRLKEEEAMVKIIDKLEKNKQIIKSRSAWSFPVIMVPKKDGTLRKVVN
ncbi:Hypothetical protein SRAE_X000233100 [Strongyloides ratti]|uniref:Uncharacterized protein n=1 Tax=Strongyloides ratti TaxID=34506 RepID=A0A090KT58_STRRB|nr:Hypothetical protein SRAE_X000233100 [Strongyloides ratti]CEF60596.1 Hypothetical protein SRAE_X000233100 [Strongyloides ratti]